MPPVAPRVKLYTNKVIQLFYSIFCIIEEVFSFYTHNFPTIFFYTYIFSLISFSIFFKSLMLFPINLNTLFLCSHAKSKEYMDREYSRIYSLSSNSFCITNIKNFSGYDASLFQRDFPIFHALPSLCAFFIEKDIFLLVSSGSFLPVHGGIISPFLHLSLYKSPPRATLSSLSFVKPRFHPFLPSVGFCFLPSSVCTFHICEQIPIFEYSLPQYGHLYFPVLIFIQFSSRLIFILIFLFIKIEKRLTKQSPVLPLNYLGLSTIVIVLNSLYSYNI